MDQKQIEGIGKRLKEVQIALGYSQNEVAEIMGISPEMYRRYCKGGTLVPTDKLLYLYNEKKFDINYVLIGERADNRDFSMQISSMPKADRDQLIEDVMNYVVRIVKK